MDNNLQELRNKVVDQDQQIKNLMKAVTLLERKIRAVSIITERTRGQTKQINEEVRVIHSKMGKG